MINPLFFDILRARCEAQNVVLEILEDREGLQQINLSVGTKYEEDYCEQNYYIGTNYQNRILIGRSIETCPVTNKTMLAADSTETCYANNYLDAAFYLTFKYYNGEDKKFLSSGLTAY